MTTEELIAQLLRNAKPIYIKPADVLLIGNIGRLPDGAWERMADVNRQLVALTGAREVFLFEQEIDVKLWSQREARIQGGGLAEVLDAS